MENTPQPRFYCLWDLVTDEGGSSWISVVTRTGAVVRRPLPQDMPAPLPPNAAIVAYQLSDSSEIYIELALSA